MMTFDLLGAIGLTTSAAVVIGAIAASYAGSQTARLGLGAMLAGWFGLIVVLGTAGVFDYWRGIGTPGIGMAVLLPVLTLTYAARRFETIRSAVLAIPLAVLVGVNFVRILGLFFVLLHAAGRLPAPFAPVAGWGDVLIGAAALPVTWAIIKQIPGWRSITLTWNTFGLADLAVAVALGVTSAQGSPIRLFFTEPSTAIMSGLPWVLIPAFLVPALMLTHLAVFYRLLTPAWPAHPAQA